MVNLSIWTEGLLLIEVAMKVPFLKPHLSLFVPIIMILLPTLYFIYAFYAFTVWEQHFAGSRVTRCHRSSPSNKRPPSIKSWKQNKDKTLQNAKLHQGYNSWEMLRCLKDSQLSKTGNRIHQELVQRIDSLVPDKLFLESSKSKLLSDETATELNMDHIYVRFFDFLWVYTFVGPFAYLLWKKGTTMLSIRKNLHERGWIERKPLDVNKLVATLCLEQTQAIHYYTKEKEGSTVGFFFADFPYIENEGCQYKVADLFAVDIDLNKKEFVRARLDNESLTASETLTLLWFNTIAAQHVKLHALANWGINHSDEMKAVNPFLYRNSVITVLYNWFGFTCFKGYFDTWKSMNLLSKDWNEETLIDCFKHGVRENIWAHPNITDLSKHSRFVSFIVKTRAVFITEFAKHKDLFPGVDGEAMFVGTVLHSLDHYFMDCNLEDPLWLNVDHPRFGMMAELGRVVKVGFVSDLPFISFPKRFKGCGHPFYEAVYRKAAKFDKELADQMDTCIIK